MVGAGVGQDGVDGGGGRVGDGQDDGGLPGVVPEDGLQAESCGEAFAEVVGGVGEQSGGVGQLIDQRQVAIGERRGIFDGPQFGFEGGFLVVPLAELLGEPVTDRAADRVGLPG